MNKIAPEAQATIAQWGERLRQAREERQLSQTEAATHLHLKQDIIDKLEVPALNTDIASVFMIGYCRSYAKLLNLPEQEIDNMVKQFNTYLVDKKHSFILEKTKIPFKYRRWINVSITLGLIGLVSIWYCNHDTHENTENKLNLPMTDVKKINPTDMPFAAPSAAEPGLDTSE